MKIIGAVLVFFTLLIFPSTALASSASEVIERVDSDTTLINNLVSKIEAVQSNPDLIIATLTTDIPIVTQHLINSSTFYKSKISSEKDSEFRTIVTNINANIEGMTDSLFAVQASIELGDPESYLSSFAQFDSYLVPLNQNIDDLNKYAETGNDYSWLLIPFLIALLISGALFIMSRGNPVLPAEQLRNKFEFALFKSSLWPLVGSAISYFGYLLTPPGGTFYVLYGLIFVGYFQFFRGLYTYLTKARPAVNLAMKEEKEKLAKLIKTEKFKKEDVEGMADEIVKMQE